MDNILAIVKTTMEDQFCTITWIKLSHEGKDITRIWTGFVNGTVQCSSTGDTEEGMLGEIDYLLKGQWEIVYHNGQ